MAWAKGLSRMFNTAPSTERPEFIKTELSLLDTSSLKPIRRVRDKEEQHKLLIKKLRLCTVICDFRLAQEYANVDEKKRIFNKTGMLHEICSFLKKNSEWNTLAVITQIFETISSNLFRPMPDSYHISHLMGVDHHVPITYTLPSWQHLEIVYQILSITFSNTNIDQLLLTEYIKKYNFIDNFVYLLNTLDKNERHQIQSVLETFYDEHGNIFEKELIHHLVNYCSDFIHYERGSAEGIQSILNIFNSMSVIDREIYENILMPLHKMPYKHFRCYEFVLWIYCKRIIEQDEHLSLILFYNLLRFWPVTNVFKEQQFLKKIAVILDFIDEDIWKDIDENLHPNQYTLLKRIAYKILHCLQTIHHYKTIIDILDLLEQEEVQEFIDKYGAKHLWCSIYQALYDVVTHFFYFETINKTRETMSILKEQDEIPMKYRDTFVKIEQNEIRMFPLKPERKKLTARRMIERKKKYEQLTRVAHDSALYKKLEIQKDEQAQERIVLLQRQQSLQQQKTLRKRREAEGKSTPQLYPAPPPPQPVIEASPSAQYMPPVPMKKNIPKISLQALSKKDVKRSKSTKKPKGGYVITPKKRSMKKRVKKTLSLRPINTSNNNNTPQKKQYTQLRKNNSKAKASLKKSQSTGSVLKAIQPKKKHMILPSLPAKTRHMSDDEAVYDEDESYKITEIGIQIKREKKNQKNVTKLLTKKVRARKSIDIDRKNSAISNPLPPQADTPHAEKYTQFVANNQRNDYLNTEYYYGNMNDKPLPNTPTKRAAPTLALSSSAVAILQSPTHQVSDSIPIKTIKNGRSAKRPQHIKAKSMFHRSKTPPDRKLPPHRKLPIIGQNQPGFEKKSKSLNPYNYKLKMNSNNTKAESMGAILHKFKPLPQNARNKKLPPLPLPK